METLLYEPRNLKANKLCGGCFRWLKGKIQLFDANGKLWLDPRLLAIDWLQMQILGETLQPEER